MNVQQIHFDTSLSKPLERFTVDENELPGTPDIEARGANVLSHGLSIDCVVTRLHRSTDISNMPSRAVQEKADYTWYSNNH